MRKKNVPEREFRSLREEERAVLEKLLQNDFPGADALREQLPALRGRTIDTEGSLELRSDENVPLAEVDQRVPIEAKFMDRDGVAIRVLLHVVGGLLKELEFYKDDGSAYQREVVADELRVYSMKVD